MRPIPLLAADLIAELNEDYPERCADMNDSERMVFFKSGQRALVRSLNARLAQSQTDDLDAHSVQNTMQRR